MRDLLDVKGASGATYRFNLFRDGRPLSPMGGNFIYVRETENSHEIIFVGEGQNLLTDAHRRWSEAVAMHGALHLFTRLNITERTRQQEHVDIADAVRPAMGASTISGAEP